jgi:hypothetical protein
VKGYALLFGRAFLQVSLVSANVVQIAHAQYLGAFIVGTLISLLWFFNARSAALNTLPGAAACYALGAGVGTVAGAWLSRLVIT